MCGQQSGISYQLGPFNEASEIKGVFTSDARGKGWGFFIYVFLADEHSASLDPEPLPGTEGSMPDSASSTAAPNPGPAATTAAPNPGPEIPTGFDCGLPVSNRIVGGNVATPFSIPWQIGLVNTGSRRPFCGGTLISPIHVLTAAHCTEGQAASNLQVIVGEHDLNSDTDGVAHDVACKSDHSQYNSQTYDYDYSVLTLSKPVDIVDATSNARAACLPATADDYATDTLTVSGWGALASGGSFPTVLHHVQVPAVTNQQCMTSYGSSITDRMLCAGQPNGGIDSCQGDSGGPLTAEENGRTTVVGVVSWGIGCAQAGYYGVYARVTTVLDWIKSHGVETATNKCSS